MGTLTGFVTDKVSGEPVAAQVHVKTPRGVFTYPEGSILKVGPEHPFFYADGEFRIEVPRGKVEVLVERGTEYVPLRKTAECNENGSVDLDLGLERWTDLPDRGWFPGNTHIHYGVKEDRPDERLHLDPRVHNLRLTVISILNRRNLRYASNKYSPGLLTDFSTAHHTVECGEE